MIKPLIWAIEGLPDRFLRASLTWKICGISGKLFPITEPSAEVDIVALAMTELFELATEMIGWKF